MCLLTAIRIRPATAADRPAVDALRANLASAYATYPGKAGPAGSETPGPTHAETLVLEWSGTVLGLAEWAAPETPASPARLLSLVVAPSVQKAGFARLLLQALRAETGRKGLTGLELEAPLDALPALTRLGARPDRLSNRPIHGQSTAQCVIMTLSI